MTRRFRLAPVLRARNAQEQIARAEVARANGAAAEARTEVARRADRLARSSVPSPANAEAFVAAVAARSALAAELAIALYARAAAETHVQQRTQEWTDAAVRRRGLERLEERHQAALVAADQRMSQHEIDDLATRRAGQEGQR